MLTERRIDTFENINMNYEEDFSSFKILKKKSIISAYFIPSLSFHFLVELLTDELKTKIEEFI